MTASRLVLADDSLGDTTLTGLAVVHLLDQYGSSVICSFVPAG